MFYGLIPRSVSYFIASSYYFDKFNPNNSDN